MNWSWKRRMNVIFVADNIPKERQYTIILVGGNYWNALVQVKHYRSMYGLHLKRVWKIQFSHVTTVASHMSGKIDLFIGKSVTSAEVISTSKQFVIPGVLQEGIATTAAARQKNIHRE